MEKITITYTLQSKYTKKGTHTSIYMLIRIPESKRLQIKYPHFTAIKKDWNNGGFMRGKGKHENARKQAELDNYKSDTIQFIKDFYAQNKKYPIKEDIEHFIFHGSKPDTPSIPKRKKDEKIVKDFISEVKKVLDDFENGKIQHDGRRLTQSSINGYYQIIAVLEKFEKTKRKRLTLLNIIEESTIREIEQYLTNDLKMKLNTVGKRLKNLKTFLNILYKRKLIHCNPFEMYGIKVPKEKVYNIALAEEELIELENLDLTNNLSLEHVRDHFLIMCYTSLRYSDYSNFINCDLSMNVVNVWSQKTGELSCVPILPPVARIISKYNGKLPKLISSQKMALYIKEVCGMIPSLCRMTSKAFTRGGRRVVEESPRYMMISNHTARRTFVTLMKRWGIDDATIMKVTGHRDARTLKTYDKMQQEEVVLKLIQDVSGKFGSII